jgi:hypothetical protein
LIITSEYSFHRTVYILQPVPTSTCFSETAMGVSVQAQTGGQAEYIKAVKRLETCP